MADRREPMDRQQLAALLDSQISDAKSFEGGDLRERREKALQYVEGEMVDVPSETGRSSATSHDLADTLAWVMASLMRVFLSSDKVVVFEPKQPSDEAFAKQATEYINFAFLRRCHGYRHIREAIYNGLLHGNGVLMHWWDDTIEHETHTLNGLTPAEAEMLLNDPDVEVLAFSEYPDPSVQMGAGMAPGLGAPESAGMAPLGGEYAASQPAMALPPTPMVPRYDAGPTPQMMDPTSFAQDGMAMPAEVATQIPTDGGDLPPDVMGQLPALMGAMAPPVPMLVDVKIKVAVSKGRLKIESLEPDNFFIDPSATVLDETVRYCGVRSFPTRSELVTWGYDPDIVDDLPEYVSSIDDVASGARGRGDTFSGGNVVGHAAERVEVWEWFPLVDYNGDGIAERLRVVIADKAGYTGEYHDRILEISEWEDDLPFTDLTPNPTPHRWRGRSLADETMDLQQINTVLWRGFLDNLYWTNNQRTKGPLSQVRNPDELFNPTFGGHIDVTTPDAIQEVVVPYVGDKTLQGIDAVNKIREFRTGISAATQGLDPDVLQNQTATAVNAAQSAARSMIEEYARNIKEIGLPRFFTCLLKLSVKHANKPEVIRLSDQWVQVDPRQWNADMDVSINTGLGTGNRERDAMAMQAIMGVQEKIIGALGLKNPICGLEEIANSAARYSESLNIRNHTQFFRDVNKEDIARMEAEKQPSPEEQKLQLEAQKVQAEQQIRVAEITERGKAEQAKARIDVWKAQQAAQIEIQTTREQAAIALQTQREKMQFELAKFREQMQAEYAIKQQEMAWEFQLERQRQNTRMTNEPTEMGGDPG